MAISQSCFSTAVSNLKFTRRKFKMCLDFESLEITALVDEAVKLVVKLGDELVELVIVIVVIIERLEQVEPVEFFSSLSWLNL